VRQNSVSLKYEPASEPLPVIPFLVLAIGVDSRELFIGTLLVRIHLIIEMILVDRPCTMGV